MRLDRQTHWYHSQVCISYIDSYSDIPWQIDKWIQILFILHKYIIRISLLKENTDLNISFYFLVW